MFSFLSENKYVEHEVQKGFTPKVSGTIEHMSQMSYLTCQDKAAIISDNSFGS